MAQTPGIELVRATVERVLPFRDSAAVVLSAENKRFMIFVGLFEATALMREVQGEKTDRPLTHDVVAYILTGFDITVEKVVISSIVNNIFCATLVLEQTRGDTKQDVRLDIRASDSLVIAMKAKVPIWVTRRVLEAVEDVTDMLRQIDEKFAGSTEEEPDESDAGLGGSAPEGDPPA